MSTAANNPPVRHTHMTRDIRPQGSGCPACDNYWKVATTEAIQIKVAEPQEPQLVLANNGTLSGPLAEQYPDCHEAMRAVLHAAFQGVTP